MSPQVTQISVLTPEGRGAVAVVAVWGDRAVAATDQFFCPAGGHPMAEQPLGRIVYGHWRDEAGEDLVVCRRGNCQLEIHCHGGRQSSRQIVADLVAAGCVAVDWRQWEAQRSDCPLAAAARIALAEAATLPAARILLDQYHGALRGEVVALRQALAGGGPVHQVQERLEGLLGHSALGLHLARPWRVVLAGLPNVGKSSLINAMLGYQRAIVFDQPGTTRDVVSAKTAIAGWPVELADTAGLHQASGPIERAGIGLARTRLTEADLVVWVFDARQLVLDDQVAVETCLQEQTRDAGVELEPRRTLAVVNKIDLARPGATFGEQVVCTCALWGEGFQDLLDRIAARLVPQVPPRGAAVPFTAGQVDRLTAAQAACQRGDPQAADDQLQQLLTQPVPPTLEST